jgi:hypothetical protein
MKKSILPLILLGSVIMLGAFSTGTSGAKGTVETTAKSTVKSKTATLDLGSFYWFDITNTWMGTFTMRDWEEFVTGFDHYTYFPRTVQERGWYPYNVGYYENGAPYVIYPQYPDIILYSHP